jgi:hypothetical protein
MAAASGLMRPGSEELADMKHALAIISAFTDLCCLTGTAQAGWSTG